MTTEAAAYLAPIQITHSVYVSIPFVGEAFACCERRARGRSFFDTDLDLPGRKESARLTVFIGRWEVVMDPPACLRSRAALMVWRCTAMPALMLASFVRVMSRL
ncbi:hypothetical protein SAMN02745157_4029 [Kaistia soli DSM 19436]|uniref:Uncharacterized protein n=1 Tax=Kaistia soli DSM 19436 TaxID=1122133 RepID=A0A1M5IX46_9HYPH|nr:hypothetical protein [Kaistia soli]SHG32894.1 hypothetical protein SAMN02745157_4029 [Kaistia soli DSM 19436]